MFHTHLHLFNWTTHRNQFELLAVLVINHLHIFVLTSGRNGSRSRSRHNITRLTTRLNMTIRILHFFSFWNIQESNSVHIQVKD